MSETSYIHCQRYAQQEEEQRCANQDGVLEELVLQIHLWKHVDDGARYSFQHSKLQCIYMNNE